MSLILSGTDGLSDVDGSAATPAIKGTDANTGIFFPAADTVGVSTGGSERVRVDSSGNVGIGTSNPSAPLTVKSRSADNVGLRVLQSSGGTGQIQFTDDPVTSAWAALTATSTLFNVSGGTTVAFTTAGTERARIDSSGNVGIGTSSPAVKLHVSGGTQRIQSTGSTSDAVLTLQNDVGTQAILGIVSSGNSPANNFFIETNGGKTVYVTSTGLFQFNNGYGSAATAYGCRAWVNYNVSSGTSAVIRGSGNITSVTYVGTGSSTVNFATAMPDVNYCVKGTASSIGLGNNNTYASVPENGTISTSAVSIIYVNDAGGSRNPVWVWVAIIR